MDVFYIFNSGFTIEIGDDALIFDYYRGSLDKAWRMPLNKAPSEYRGVYVFASHVHADHYNRAIFDWLSERGDIRYILSNDIKPEHARLSEAQASLRDRKKIPAGADCASGTQNPDATGQPTMTFIGSGDSIRVGNLDIRAFGSTDAGVSFHVVAEDKTSFFHAGDYNYWHWQDESTRAEVSEAYSMFSAELDKIKNGVDRLDVAFFPVDPRMGADYYRGAVLFCAALKPKILVPMHFSSVFSPPDSFFKEIAPYTKVVRVGPGAGKLDLQNAK